MTLNELARQMRLEPSRLLDLAENIDLNVTNGNSVISAEDEWKLRKAAVRPEPAEQTRQPAGPIAWHRVPPRPLPPATPRQRSQKKVPPPSDLAKVFLERDSDFVSSFMNPPPWHVRVERAEKTAREWGRCMFDAREANEWVKLHGSISPDVAASLRDAGLSAEQAITRIRTERGYVEKLPLTIRVSSGELTAEQAAAELRAMTTRHG